LLGVALTIEQVAVHVQGDRLAETLGQQRGVRGPRTLGFPKRFKQGTPTASPGNAEQEKTRRFQRVSWWS
jgi:hypothetical protein